MATGRTSAAGSVPVVPAPVHVSHSPGKATFLLSGMRVVTDPDPVAVGVAVLAATRVGDLGGFPVDVVHEDDGEPGALVLQLVTDPLDAGLPTALDPERCAEAYSLEVTGGRAIVTATHGGGLLRGVATLNQLARPVRVPTPLVPTQGVTDVSPAASHQGASPPRETHVHVPAVRVTDHPRFLWRGVSLDPAAPELTGDGVATLMAIMAELKLNVLRLPVDRGWVDGPGADPGVLGAVLTHAAARQITVVPGVDLRACAAGEVDHLASVSPGPWVDLTAGWSAVPVTALRAAVDVVRAAGKRVVCGPPPEGLQLPAGSVVVTGGGADAVGPAPDGSLALASWSCDGHDLRSAYQWEPSALLPALTVRTTAGTEIVLRRCEARGVLDQLAQLAAMAEVGWTAPARRSWDSFCGRLDAQGLIPSQAATGAGATSASR